MHTVDAEFTPLDFFFTIQGEGNGHYSQAIAFAEQLKERGHRITAVGVAAAPERAIPEYVKNFFGNLLFDYPAPYLLRSSDNKRILLIKTLIINFLRLPIYLRSFYFLKKKLARHRPAAVVNFYETLAACAIRHAPGSTLKVVVGHQLYFDHQAFNYPKGEWGAMMLQKINNKVCRWGVALPVALTLRKIPADNKLLYVPPLLRSQCTSALASNVGHVLSYCTYSGYVEEVCNLAGTLPEQTFELYTSATTVGFVPPNVYLYNTDAAAFIQSLATCSMLLTTCGFETLCEALYLGKPFAAVPVHYEQRCNAADFSALVPLHTADRFDVLTLAGDEQRAAVEKQAEVFKNYYNNEKHTLLHSIERALNNK